MIMNIVKNIDQYNEDYVYFCDPIKNNIMNELENKSNIARN